MDYFVERLLKWTTCEPEDGGSRSADVRCRYYLGSARDLFTFETLSGAGVDCFGEYQKTAPLDQKSWKFLEVVCRGIALEHWWGVLGRMDMYRDVALMILHGVCDTYEANRQDMNSEVVGLHGIGRSNMCIWAGYLHGVIEYRSGRYRDANRIFRQLAKECDEDNNVCILMGYLQPMTDTGGWTLASLMVGAASASAMMGEFKDSADLLQEIDRCEGKNYECLWARVLLVISLWKIGRKEDALEMVEKSEKLCVVGVKYPLFEIDRNVERVCNIRKEMVSWMRESDEYREFCRRRNSCEVVRASGEREKQRREHIYKLLTNLECSKAENVMMEANREEEEVCKDYMRLGICYSSAKDMENTDRIIVAGEKKCRNYKRYLDKIKR